MADFDGRLVTLDDVQVFGATVQHDVADRDGKLVTVGQGSEDVKILTGTVQHDVADRQGQLVRAK